MRKVLANEFFAFGRRAGTFPTAAVKGGGNQATFPVIIPQMKHASSLAIAVLATFTLRPLLIIL